MKKETVTFIQACTQTILRMFFKLYVFAELGKEKLFKKYSTKEIENTFF